MQCDTRPAMRPFTRAAAPSAAAPRQLGCPWALRRPRRSTRASFSGSAPVYSLGLSGARAAASALLSVSGARGWPAESRAAASLGHRKLHRALLPLLQPARGLPRTGCDETGCAAPVWATPRAACTRCALLPPRPTLRDEGSARTSISAASQFLTTARASQDGACSGTGAHCRSVCAAFRRQTARRRLAWWPRRSLRCRRQQASTTEQSSQRTGQSAARACCSASWCGEREKTRRASLTPSTRPRARSQRTRLMEAASISNTASSSAPRVSAPPTASMCAAQSARMTQHRKARVAARNAGGQSR